MISDHADTMCEGKRETHEQSLDEMLIGNKRVHVMHQLDTIAMRSHHVRECCQSWRHIQNGMPDVRIAESKQYIRMLVSAERQHSADLDDQ